MAEYDGYLLDLDYSDTERGHEVDFYPLGVIVQPPPPPAPAPRAQMTKARAQRPGRLPARLSRLPTGHDITDRALDAIRQAFNNLAQADILDGDLITVDLQDNVNTRVAHGLGRTYRGFIPCGIRGAVSNGRIDEVTGAPKDRELWILAAGYGATISVTLWVF